MGSCTYRLESRSSLGSPWRDPPFFLGEGNGTGHARGRGLGPWTWLRPLRPPRAGPGRSSGRRRGSDSRVGAHSPAGARSRRGGRAVGVGAAGDGSCGRPSRESQGRGATPRGRRPVGRGHVPGPMAGGDQEWHYETFCGGRHRRVCINRSVIGCYRRRTVVGSV